MRRGATKALAKPLQIHNTPNGAEQTKETLALVFFPYTILWLAAQASMFATNCYDHDKVLPLIV